MPKAKPEPSPMLAFACKCSPDYEMVYAGTPTDKMFRKFYCKECKSTLWMSTLFFNKADENHEIMEPSTQ